MATSGTGSQFGLKRESSWGTAVTVDKFFEFASETLSLDPAYADGAGLVAGRTFNRSSQTKLTTRVAGGDVALPVPTKLFGSFLDLCVAGTITPVQQASTIAYLSTFNIGGSVPTKSVTAQVNKPTTQGVDTAFTYPGAVLSQLAFSIDTSGFLNCTASFVAKDETTPATTPAGAALASASYASGTRMWVHPEMTLTLNGSAAAAVTGINWTWTQPLADGRLFLGSATRAKPVPNGLATITGTLSAEWLDSTYYDLFRSGAFVGLVIGAADPTAIASTYYPTFTNTFSAIQVRGSSPQVSGPDLLTQDVPFVVRDDGTNPPWKAEYLSTDSTAW